MERVENALAQYLLPQPAARKGGTGVGTRTQEVARVSASAESGAHQLLPLLLSEPPLACRKVLSEPSAALFL